MYNTSSIFALRGNGEDSIMKTSIDGVAAFAENADRYLQFDDISGADLSRIWGGVQAAYPDYDTWFCYHNTEPPLAWLNEIGAALEDDCAEMRLLPARFQPGDTLGAGRVTGADFAAFAAYHDACNPNMYWTGERIGRDLSRWGIFVLRADDAIIAYLLLALGDPLRPEIFCVQAFDAAQHKALISIAAGTALEGGAKELLYMADPYGAGHTAALSVGFAVTGFYKGYAIKRAKSEGRFNA